MKTCNFPSIFKKKKKKKAICRLILSQVVNDCVVREFKTNQESQKTHGEQYLMLLFVPEYALSAGPRTELSVPTES